MRNAVSSLLLALSMLPSIAAGQVPSPTFPNPSSADAADTLQSPHTSRFPGPAGSSPAANLAQISLGGKFHYYLTESYFNPSAITAPAFRAGLRMANPPGKGATEYPPAWRQGAEAFGRNYGDAVAERVSFQTARFLTGVVTREDPRYFSSGSGNGFARSFHALAFCFVDRSDSGRAMPAFSNFAGAAAGGFVGNAYLPPGFNDVTHADQRATVRFGFFAAGNLFREFAPQIPGPVRAAIMLIAR